MSLEDTIKENTAAVLALTAALQSGAWSRGYTQGQDVAPSPTSTLHLRPNENGETLRGVAETAASVAAGAAVAAAGQPELAPAAAAAAEVTVAAVLKAASKLISVAGKDSVKTALASFSAKSIKDIPTPQLADALAKVNAALEAAEQAKQAA